MKVFIRTVLFLFIVIAVLSLVNINKFNKVYNYDVSQLIGINYDNFNTYYRNSNSTLTPMQSVEIIWISDVDSVNKQLNSRGEYVAGSSQTSSLRDDLCLIYAHIPESETDIQRLTALGHEVLHCFVGQFHD